MNSLSAKRMILRCVKENLVKEILDAISWKQIVRYLSFNAIMVDFIFPNDVVMVELDSSKDNSQEHK